MILYTKYSRNIANIFISLTVWGFIISFEIFSTTQEIELFNEFDFYRFPNDDIEQPIYYPDQNIENDNQNVHDSIVNNTLRKSIDKLKESVKDFTISKRETIKQIEKLINEKFPEDNLKKQKALYTLSHIESQRFMIMSANTTLLDALHLTWNRIHQPEFSDP